MKDCKTCKTCERRDKVLDECQVFKTKPKKCWAWTDDPKWLTKAMKDVRKYRKYKNGDIAQYWR